METAAASTMDFHALSRRELQALCKRNGVRANMTNAAMAEALQVLTSVDGIDEIGTTLCLPTPGRSTMKSAAKVAAVAGEEQQHGSPLPRGRRVLVMSPAAIRMDVEEGEDELKRDLVKEIVKTPGVALRSTSRRARATPAPLPTPATLRRSTRTAARKAAAPVEAENLAEDVSTVKRTTRRTPARSKMMVDLDKEAEVAAATPKLQQEEPQAVASKCDDPEEEEEVTKLLDGDNKEEELEEGEEADSSDAANLSALLSDKSCDDCKAEQVADVVEEEAIKPHEGLVAEQEPTSVEKSAPLARMEDSPILGVLSKDEATESVIEKEQYATGENGEGVAEWSPVNEMTDEINPVTEDMVVAASEEAIKEDGFTVTSEIVHSPKQILPAAAAEDETSEEYDLTEGKEGAADEMQQTELIEDETSEDGELDEDEEWTSDDDEASEEIDSTGESDDEIDEINERDYTEVSTDLNQEKELVQMPQETAITMEASEDESAEEASVDGSDEDEASDDGSDEEGSDEEGSERGSAEDDDFSSDLPPEFDNIVLSDAETESDTTLQVLEENQVALASATKSAVKSLDDSAIIEVQELSSAEASEKADNEEAMKEVDNTVNTIVKSLDEFTIEEGTKETEEKQRKFEDLHSKSLRQLKALVKGALNAKEGKKQVVAEGGKRLPLAEVDDNTGMDC